MKWVKPNLQYQWRLGFLLSTQNAARKKNQQDRCRRGIKSVGVQKIAGSLDSTLICLLLLVPTSPCPSALNEKPFDCRSCKIEQSGGLLNLPSLSSIRSSSSFPQILISFVVEPLGQLHWLQLYSNTGAGVCVLLAFPESHVFSLVLGSLSSPIQR